MYNRLQWEEQHTSWTFSCRIQILETENKFNKHLKLHKLYKTFSIIAENKIQIHFWVTQLKHICLPSLSRITL